MEPSADAHQQAKPGKGLENRSSRTKREEPNFGANRPHRHRHLTPSSLPTSPHRRFHVMIIDGPIISYFDLFARHIDIKKNLDGIAHSPFFYNQANFAYTFLGVPHNHELCCHLSCLVLPTIASFTPIDVNMLHVYLSEASSRVMLATSIF